MQNDWIQRLRNHTVGVDTNILIYAVSAENNAKVTIAKQLITALPHCDSLFSLQALAEFTFVGIRKLGLSPQQVLIRVNVYFSEAILIFTSNLGITVRDETAELHHCIQQLNQQHRQREEQNAARRYAQQVIGETLAELGYEVEPGFSTLFVEGGVAHIQKPEWGDY